MYLPPDLTTNTWKFRYENEFKSITLTHADDAAYTDNGDGTHTAAYSCCGTTVTENHSGGTATCEEQAKCEHCGASYGEVNPDNHSWDSATGRCVCGVECAHSWENASCTGCGAVDTSNGPVITQQPTDASAAMGDNYCVTVEAQGDGLTHTWYFKNAGTNVWHKSGVTDDTYDDVMTKARAGREVYCVITDIWGNTVTTETVTLICTDGTQAIAMN